MCKISQLVTKNKKKQIKKSNQDKNHGSFLSQKTVCIGLILLTCLLYGNSLFNEYTLDDAIVITDNEFTQKGVSGIIDIFTKDSFHGFFGEAGKDKLVSGGRYRPFTIAMFAIEKTIFGNGPFFHHLINILLYGLIGILIYFVGSNVFNQVFDSEKASFIAFAMAVFFLAHPIHTEAVANIKGRDEIMAFLGSISALFVLTKKSFEHLSFKDYALASLFLFIGLLSKENAITFIMVIPLVAYLFYQKSVLQSFKIALPFLGIAILFILIRTMVIGFDFGSAPSNEFMNNPYLKIVNNQYVPFSYSEKFATISFTLIKYIQLLIFPYPLTHDYYPNHISLKTFGNPMALLGVITYLGLIGISIWGLVRRKIWSFFTSYYLITISIVSNIVFAIGTHMSERFVFMPSLAFSGLLAMVIYGIAQKSKIKWIVLSSILFIYIILTINRNRVWKDNYTLFTTDAITSSQSAKVNNAAGGAIGDKIQNMTDGAEKTALIEKAHMHLTNALAAHPNYVNAYLLQGNTYFYEKKYEEALNQYNKCLRIDPEYKEAKTNKLITLRSAGRYYGEIMNDLNQSLAYLTQAIALDPNDFETNRLIGTCYGIMGNHENAVKHFTKCIELDPNNASLYVSIGKAYEFLGNIEEANRAYAKAKSIDPSVINQ